MTPDTWTIQSSDDIFAALDASDISVIAPRQAEQIPAWASTRLLMISQALSLTETDAADMPLPDPVRKLIINGNFPLMGLGEMVTPKTGDPVTGKGYWMVWPDATVYFLFRVDRETTLRVNNKVAMNSNFLIDTFLGECIPYFLLNSGTTLVPTPDGCGAVAKPNTPENLSIH